jgi:hypothetical protein
MSPKNCRPRRRHFPARPPRPLSIDALLADHRDVQLATLVTDVPQGELYELT